MYFKVMLIGGSVCDFLLFSFTNDLLGNQFIFRVRTHTKPTNKMSREKSPSEKIPSCVYKTNASQHQFSDVCVFIGVTQ